MDNPINHGRRRFLQFTTLTAAGFITTPAIARPKARPRELQFYNLHTGESLDATYWADGYYQRSELSAVNHLLRDHRSGEIAKVDPKLLDLLYRVQMKLGSREKLHIISGYRSPKTNEQLRRHSSGVAKKSMHTQGRAIDFYLPDRELSQIRKVALSLKGGGVGYYPGGKVKFVHMDTGRVRRW